MTRPIDSAARRGSYNILSVLVIPVLLAFAALTIDTSFLSISNAQTSAVAEQAARTGLIVYRQTKDADSARAAALQSMYTNRLFGNDIAGDLTLTFGEYTSANGVSSGPQINALTIDIVRPADTHVGFFSNKWAPGLIGAEHEASATVAAAPRQFFLAHDNGATMRNDILGARTSLQRFVQHLRDHPHPQDAIGLTTYTTDVAASPTLDMAELDNPTIDATLDSFDLCNCTGDFFDAEQDIDGASKFFDHTSDTDEDDALICGADWDDWADFATLLDVCDPTALSANPDLVQVAEDLGILDLSDLCDLECPELYCGTQYGGYNRTPQMADCHMPSDTSEGDVDPKAVSHGPAIAQAHAYLAAYGDLNDTPDAYRAIVLIADDAPSDSYWRDIERRAAGIAEANLAESRGIDIHVVMVRHPSSFLPNDESYLASLVRGGGSFKIVRDSMEFDHALETIATNVPLRTVLIN
jgi:hypothetical protein